MKPIDEFCEVMHDAYERAAVGAGWETNPASRKPWADVPESNKITMRAAVMSLLRSIADEIESSRPEIGPQINVNSYRDGKYWGMTLAASEIRQACENARPEEGE